MALCHLSPAWGYSGCSAGETPLSLLTLTVTSTCSERGRSFKGGLTGSFFRTLPLTQHHDTPCAIPRQDTAFLYEISFLIFCSVRVAGIERHKVLLILSGKQLDILKSLVPEGHIMNAYLLEVAIDWKMPIVSRREEPLKNHGVSRISFELGHLKRERVVNIYRERCSFLCSWSCSVTQPHTSNAWQLPDDSSLVSASHILIPALTETTMLEASASKLPAVKTFINEKNKEETFISCLRRRRIIVEKRSPKNCSFPRTVFPPAGESLQLPPTTTRHAALKSSNQPGLLFLCSRETFGVFLHIICCFLSWQNLQGNHVLFLFLFSHILNSAIFFPKQFPSVWGETAFIYQMSVSLLSVWFIFHRAQLIII